MIKQPNTDMLIRSMEKMEVHGLPDQPLPDRNQPEPFGIHLEKGRVPGESYSDIMFVNEAYDSRKTGINELLHLPSAYRIYIGFDFFSFTCHQLKSRRHGHFAIQLAFNFEAPFLLRMDESKETELFFFIIPAFVPHRLVSPAGKHLSILVDPLSLLGRKLNALLENPDSFTTFTRAVIDRVYPYLQTRLSEFETANFLNNTIAHLNRLIAKVSECQIDERIRHAITCCQAKGGEKLFARDLAEWTALSESRARHLFKEQTGVSFTQYLKWLKIMEAVKYACMTGGSLTEAAHMAGFSDSAHLSRTFKEMFGLVPSSVLK